ncbi:hypothetical protein EDC04DRAFT_3145921 [Pisolithus marmoratus]|nr:hypothetical protein EDC04DRAFT_3145921 [Pisolithus marmoratus]
MAERDSRQAPPSGRGRQTWKWVAYITACYASHVTLIIIHVVLLALHEFEREKNVTVPSGISNDVASTGVTVILQTFGTGYCILLVWLTQRLSVRRELLQYQTLTATHDTTGAWSGLGAALSTVWDQTKLKAAARGVFLVTLYLAGIAVLHITSSSLMSLVPFNNTEVAYVTTQYEMLNLADLPINSYWTTATALIRSVTGYPAIQTIGLQNATLFETLPTGSGYGPTQVKAVTFSAQCYSLYNVSAIATPGGTYNISASNGTQPPVTYPPVYGFYNNVSYAVGADGKTVTILTTPPILDANLDSGSTFNITQNVPTQGGSNETETITIQIMTCVLSLTNQAAIINASTNALLTVSPPSPSPNPIWTPWQANSTGNPDPQLDWFGSAWTSSALTTDFYGPIRCAERACLLSFMDEYLMALLGAQYNGTTVIQSTPTFPRTLSGFESSIAEVASGAAWAVLTTSGYYKDSTNGANVVKSDFKLHLTINLTQVSVGLFFSILLLVLSSFLIHSPAVGTHHGVELSSCGILQVIWLSSCHDGIRGEVANAEPSKLREVGLRCTTAFGDGSSSQDQIAPVKGP